MASLAALASEANGSVGSSDAGCGYLFLRGAPPQTILSSHAVPFAKENRLPLKAVQFIRPILRPDLFPDSGFFFVLAKYKMAQSGGAGLKR